MSRARASIVVRSHARSALFACGAALAACSGSGRGPAPEPLPPEWTVRTCFVADSGAATSTLFVVGTRVALGATTSSDHCPAARAWRDADNVTGLAPLPGADLRDVLDVGVQMAGVDLPVTVRPAVLVTTDPLVIAYAGARDAYVTTALPWSLTYVMVSSAAHPLYAATTTAARDALARDAVSASARGAREPFPWLTDSTCASPAPSSPIRPRPVVAYAEGDATARELAERIVALAGALQVMPLARDSMAAALERGGIAAAVHAVPRDPRAPCTTRDGAQVPLNAVPLVDAREHAIVRRGSGAAFVIGADGSLRFVSRARQ